MSVLYTITHLLSNFWMLLKKQQYFVKISIPMGSLLNNHMNIYYIYLYSHPITHVPFYVGMGKGNRKFAHLKEAKTRPTPQAGEHKLNTIRQMLLEGLEPIITVIDSNISKEQAIDGEITLISLIGRRDLGLGPLTNQTAGGDGNRGWSKSARQAQRDRNLRSGIIPPSQKGLTQNRHPDYTAVPAIIVETGNRTKVLITDIRWKTGEIVGINKGIVQDAGWRKKNSEALAKLKWWNNGSRCVRSASIPGEDFISGRGKMKW